MKPWPDPSGGRGSHGRGCCCRREVPAAPWSRDGAVGVQAGTCREDCVGCRWRAWLPLWLWSGFCPIWLGLGLVSLSLLPSSLPASPIPLLLRVCTFTSPLLGARALSPLSTPGCAGPGAPTGRGAAPPQPVKGFREGSEHGEHVVLAPKGTELGALGVGSWQHPHQRQSSVRAELTLCPSLLPRPTRLSLFNNMECIGSKN